MIFATDLDRTIFYSCKNFEKYAKEHDLDYSYIDRDKDGLNKSIMSVEALELLREFSNKHDFIPVTAREERHFYDRVRFDEFGIKFNCAILGNGSKIIYKGREDEYWKNHVKSIKESIKLDDLRTKLVREYGEDIVKETSYGFEIRNSTTIEDLSITVNGFKGINIGRDHRFAYVLLNGIGKLEALKYVMENLEKTREELITAGDSFMDIPMIEFAKEKGMLSLNGKIQDELLDRVYLGGAKIIYNLGILTSRDILDTVAEHI